MSENTLDVGDHTLEIIISDTSNTLFIKTSRQKKWLWKCFVVVQLASFVTAAPSAAQSPISSFFWIGAGGFCPYLLPVLCCH